jgi:RecA-family ATPase
MLTERMQAKAIWRLIYTDDDLSAINVEDFDEPWRTIWQIAERNIERGDPPFQALTNAITRAAGSGGQGYWEETQNLLNLISAAGDDAPGNVFQSYDDLAATLPPVEWLWEPWIPRGMLSLLGAWQGTGKSWLALDLARIVTQAQIWPDGAAVARNGPCIYVEAEAVPRITVDRIRAMGIGASQIYPFLPDRYGIMDLANRAWQDRLADMLVTPFLEQLLDKHARHTAQAIRGFAVGRIDPSGFGVPFVL